MTDYTTTLKLAKPAAGESAWGNTVNTGLTDMVEEAISGLKVINTWTAATPAIHVLTSADGATSESRAAILKLTDTGGVIPTVGQVTVPANSKLYCVINETGHTVTVKTSSGTGIAVPTGTIVNLACDGTNVVEQDNFSVALNAGTITTTGQAHPASLRVGPGMTSTPVTNINSTGLTTSGTSLATESIIKSYIDGVGSFNMTQVLPATTAGGDANGFTEVTVTFPDYTTVSMFEVPSSSDTDYIVLDIGVEYRMKDTGTSGDNRVIFQLQKKSKVATGASMGASSALTRFGTGASRIWGISFVGDVTHLVDTFSRLATSASPATSYPIVGFSFTPQVNRTTVYINSGSTITANMGSVGDTVYISNDGFIAVNSYADGINLIEADAPYGSSSQSSETFSFPRVLCKATGGAYTEFRVQAKTNGTNETAYIKKWHINSQDVKGKL